MVQICTRFGPEEAWRPDMVQICTRFGLEKAWRPDVVQICTRFGPEEAWRPDMVQICTRFGLEKAVTAACGADLHQIWPGEGSDSRMWCRFAPDLAWRRQWQPHVVQICTRFAPEKT